MPWGWLVQGDRPGADPAAGLDTRQKPNLACHAACGPSASPYPGQEARHGQPALTIVGGGLGGEGGVGKPARGDPWSWSRHAPLAPPWQRPGRKAGTTARPAQGRTGRDPAREFDSQSSLGQGQMGQCSGKPASTAHTTGSGRPGDAWGGHRPPASAAGAFFGVSPGRRLTAPAREASPTPSRGDQGASRPTLP
ncbi:MAG: hypothetical protein LBP92_06730 [Deltaproteobacteria bacterium]|nr:hypothetical protein [Deltaproteobacteria bacterium]